MKEIRIHGRGGQGVITLANLISVAAFYDGRYSQAFPFFGVERRNFPVTSFVRISNKPIKRRDFVYDPNYVLVLDQSLTNIVDIAEGTNKDGLIIINSAEPVKLKTEAEVKTIDLTKIALNIFSKPFVNAPMAGAFAKITNEISIESLKKAVNEKFSDDLAKLNNKAVKMVYSD